MTRAAEWRAGRSVVLGAALGLGTGYSIWPYLASLFVLPLGEAFGWTRGQVSGVAATGLIGAAAAPLVGALTDRVGVRPVTLMAMTALGLIYLALSFMTGSLPLFYILFAALQLAGLGTIGITYTRAVTSWFSASRGLALGLSLFGVPFAAIVLPRLLSAAMAAGGWANGYRILAALALFVGAPATWLLVRERPQDEPARVRPPMGDAVWSRPFWLMIATMLLINIPGAGIVGQFQPIMIDAGLTRAGAAGLLSIYAGALFAGRAGFGYLLDRLSPTTPAAVAFGAPAIGVALLLDGHASPVEGGIVAALLGLAAGAEIDIMGFLVAQYFGLARYSTLFGAMMSALIVASAIGNVLYGRAFDATGSYHAALAGSIGGYLMGALLMVALGRIPPPAERPS